MTRVHGSLLSLCGALLLLACSRPPTPATVIKVSGDSQIGAPGEALAQPLVVRVADADGKPVAGVGIAWTVIDGDGAVSPLVATTGDDGLASAMARLGPTAPGNRYQASATNFAIYPALFQAGHSPFTLDYTDPAPGGKLRLVRHPGAGGGATLDLDLVVAPGAAVTAYSVGFNLPVDTTRVALDAKTPMTPGTALDPGSAPAAAMAVLPTSGPLKSTLVSGQSQKAAGTGAVTTDTALPPGSVLYTLHLRVQPAATPGVVFDGTGAGFALRSAGARNLAGTTVVAASEVAVGKLIVK
jgi:hypothetical protein